MTHRNEFQPLTVERLDKEIMARQDHSSIESGFHCPEGLDDHHDALEIMKGIKKLYTESASMTPDPLLSRFSTPDLLSLLRKKTRDLNQGKGIRFHDHRMDFYSIHNPRIKRQADAVAAILTRDQLEEIDPNTYRIKTFTFGKIFNLCQCEAFYHQGIARGKASTGFLVRGDVIATAAHCLKQHRLEDFRFVFGYRIPKQDESPALIPKSNVYTGTLVKKEYDRKVKGKDWALIKLDRTVEGINPLELSRGQISVTLPVYIMGYPVGLPLKYAPGACIRETHPGFFIADLDVFCGNSGSPVFNRNTYQVVGFVQKGDIRDFRRIGNCWATVIYPKYELYSQGAHCITVTSLIKVLDSI